ncbi:FtsX-like permease family protein [Dyadobacter pollutisoli]|uniref:ABC transporter permease n=1 Tax=Dyadobacter pollutisoli TaxID=2910158 RepID=A0A9E8SPX4_9BACT|nr:FtsX-like permease family protein [Dyadobacter pollutisoli]WAC15181.1 ABC transporter permease [Dyadobacter pollutisoli]
MSVTPKPPRWADYLLEKWVDDRFLEDIQGNLYEVFVKNVKQGNLAKARREYAFAAVRHLNPYFFKEKSNETRSVNMLSFDMLRNYFKAAWRHLLKDRQFTMLNLIGLSTGLVCTLLICLWVTDELGFDKFHAKDNRLYEVMIHEKSSSGIATSNGTGDRMGETLVQEMPEVEMAVTTTPSTWFQKFSLSVGNNTVSAGGNFVGQDYFNVFSFPLVQGNKNQALVNKNSIAISEKLAVQLFHSADQAAGKIVEWKWLSFSGKCLITAVFKDFPVNSSQQYDFLLSMDAWNQIMPPGSMPKTSSGPFNSFIVLKEGVDPELFDQKMADLAKTSFKDSTSRLFLHKYSDAYLHGKFENGVQAGGKITYVGLFALIAVFILVIACINFMNLSTAKASVRVKEVGVKKALGAARSTLVFQYLGESLLMSFIALFIAILVVALLLPQFNVITGKHLTLHFEPKIVLIILAISIITGLLAGSYPALHLSRFSPATTLKGALVTSFGELWVRKGLVVFQFTVSVVFIVSVVVVYRQINYVQHKNLGYDKDNMLYFEMQGRVAEQPESFLARLKSVPGVVNASSIQQKIILPASLPGTGVRWDGKNTDDRIRFYRMPVNYDLIETIGIKIAAGRSFSRSYGSDTANIILNEAAVKAMELQDPIGKTITIGSNTRHIVGVSKNFHFNSLHEEIRPFILCYSPSETMLIMTKIAAGKEKETIARMSSFYKSFNPGYSFDYQFLDHDYQVQYASETVVSELARYFAGLAIIISCLGLFGLAAFTAERRKKEIGVRKVLGATVGNVVAMLTKDFLILILVAVVIAFPLAWWLMDSWLQNFAYHISIGTGVFIATGLLIVFITLITIGYQSVKAALMNPTRSLKAD